jgi:cell division protease FtsH
MLKPKCYIIPFQTMIDTSYTLPQTTYVVKRNTLPNMIYDIGENKSAPPVQTINPLVELQDKSEWRYNDFVNAVQQNDIVTARIDTTKNTLYAVAKNGNEGYVKLPGEYLSLVDQMIAKDIAVKYMTSPAPSTVAINVLANYILPFLLLVFLFRILGSRSSGGFGNLLQFTQSQAKLQEIPDTGVTFEDVAGCEGAKEDLQEIVDFLKNPTKYTTLGAKIPKGVLLVGSPGCGKTLLAKAVAGEAGVPFFSCSGSEFVEILVGVGMRRVHDLFEQATKKAPCIIFIDEIDALGKKRSINVAGGNDERESTLNQLLTEMDGFQGNKGVIVLGATNRPDVLDSALLRTGRFDRTIRVELPDLNGRVEILKVHTKNKPLEDDVDFMTLAKQTAGSSGSDLEALANEAAIAAARENKEKINMKHFEQSLEKIAIGPERRTAVISDKQKKLVAFHEGGHTLVSLFVGDFDKVKKVTIIPRGRAGGFTLFENDIERLDSGLYTKEYLENQLAVALGGRVAEELVFGESATTTGASNDLVQVMRIARMMVSEFGFSHKMGPVAWKQGQMWEGTEGYSSRTGYEIDMEVKELVNKAYKRAKQILTEQSDLLSKLAIKLIEVETLTGDEVLSLLELDNNNSIIAI